MCLILRDTVMGVFLALASLLTRDSAKYESATGVALALFVSDHQTFHKRGAMAARHSAEILLWTISLYISDMDTCGTYILLRYLHIFHAPPPLPWKCVCVCKGGRGLCEIKTWIIHNYIDQMNRENRKKKLCRRRRNTDSKRCIRIHQQWIPQNVETQDKTRMQIKYQ